MPYSKIPGTGNNGTCTGLFEGKSPFSDNQIYFDYFVQMKELGKLIE